MRLELSLSVVGYALFKALIDLSTEHANEGVLRLGNNYPSGVDDIIELSNSNY